MLVTLVRWVGYLLLPCLFASPAWAAEALLRVYCDGDAADAEVFVDGKFKGECPVDVQVDEGSFLVRVVKKVDALRERVFEQRVRMASGTAKKIEVALGPLTFNAEGQKREAVRLAAERAEADRKEAARRQAEADRLKAEALQRDRDNALLAQQRQAADSGDANAMEALGDRYAQGRGVAKDEAQAKAWYGKAAGAGRESAHFKAWSMGRNLPSLDMDDALRLLSLPVPPERRVDLQGVEAVRQFVAADPFFDTPGGGERLTYRYVSEAVPGLPATRLSHEVLCVRDGKFNHWDAVRENPDIKATEKSVGVLGGLLRLTMEWSQGWLRPGHSVTLKHLQSVSGQPFPLMEGRTFGLTYTTLNEGTSTLTVAVKSTCGVSGPAITLPRLGVKDKVIPLVCWHKTIWPVNGYDASVFMRHYWHEKSGCFASFPG